MYRYAPFYKFIFGSISLLFLNTAYSQVFSVNTGATATQMAQELVGPGVQIISATYSGNASSKGIFTAPGTSLPMTNGVVLSSGLAASIAGAAALQASTNTNGPSNDADLNPLANGTTRDVSYLEFQFKAIGTEINFEFVFGSEEYPEYNCTGFNDVFGFFISGPGIVGKKNLALVPGTSIPVTINTINSGVPAGPLNLCTDYGAGSPFTAYYHCCPIKKKGKDIE